MKHTATPSALTITASPEERANLKTIREENGGSFSAQDETDALESLLSNSDLQWISPADSGDLTDAPMLGILGEEQREESGPYGATLTGGDEAGPLFSPILQRWGFMPYAVRSFLDDLADEGQAVFIA